MAITFRRLRDWDLPMLHAWLNDPAVVEWWEGNDVTWPAVVADHAEVHGHPEEHWIALDEDRPVGWIQCYPVHLYPEELEPWTAAGADPEVVGIDYLLGTSTDRRRGLGSAMISAFVEDVVFGLHPEWHQVAADPYVANAASWGALARAGFRHVADLPHDEGPTRLMVFDRPATTAP